MIESIILGVAVYAAIMVTHVHLALAELRDDIERIKADLGIKDDE